MGGQAFRKPRRVGSIGCVSGLALLAGQASADAPPIVDRAAPTPVTAVTAEQLQRLPANRDLRALFTAHNQLRSEFGSRPLRWNPALADKAQQYADVLAQTGTLQHSSRAGRENERENIVVGPRSGISPAQLAQIWVRERQLFRPGVYPDVCLGDWSRCSHYTQIVWPTTTEMGCGFARGRFDALVCRYSPPGNKDGVAIGPSIPRQAGGLCTSPGGTTIPCGNTPEEDGEGVTDDGGGAIDTGAKEEVACVVDVDVHRPISIAPDEPVVPEGLEDDTGATTLRNDDSDWRIRGNVPAGDLPIVALPTDIAQTNNPDENDLVKIDAANPAGLPNVYLFAFPTHAEASRGLEIEVTAVGDGRQANPQELAYFTAAIKAVPGPALPLLVPRATSFWLEAMLGGRYRMVIGKLKDGVAPGEVRYHSESRMAYVMRDKKREPAFVCEDQATVTAAVVDIFQRYQSGGAERLTAFDVYWGGRPHFRAKVWPGRQDYTWGAQYRLGPNPRDMPGTAVNDARVASMQADEEDGDDSNATFRGPQVRATGKADGSFTQKGTIEGGFQINSPPRNPPPAQPGDVPAVNRNGDDRYPHRVSLGYKVNDADLVRAEYLEVILPTVRRPAASGPRPGTVRVVESGVEYTIVDQFDRKIKAESPGEYLHFYGAGLKAWEALGEDGGRAIERGPSLDRQGQPQADRYNDNLWMTNTGAINGRGLPPVPLQTAQRSQAIVRDDRMTTGTFKDTLRFTAPADDDRREALWKAATGRLTAERLNEARTEAQDRHDAVDGRSPEGRRYASAAERRAELQRRQAAVPAADNARVASSPMIAIPQDVILQLRVDAIRYDLMVLQGNTLSVLAPYFFDDNQYRGNKNDPVFRFHIQFAPGTTTSILVAPRHRRPEAARRR